MNKLVYLKRGYILIVLALVMGLGVVLDATLIEPYRLQVTEIDLVHPDVTAGLQGLRIAQISDTHITRVGDYQGRLALKLFELQPDLIVITGDLIEHVAAYDVWTARAQAVHDFLELLPPVPYGVWASRGNTDISRYAGHSDYLVQQIRATSAQLLINEPVQLDINGTTLYLAGADFAHLPASFAADHVVMEEGGNRLLAAEPCLGNAFTQHIQAALPSEGYAFSGRLRYTDPQGGIGILFGSRFAYGEDHFYRIRRYADQPAWTLSAKGAEIANQSNEGMAPPVAGTWYRFRIRWQAGATSRIQARLWPEGETEPVAWPLEAVANDPAPPTAGEPGLIGFWSVGPGWKQFDDLAIHDLAGKLIWAEDFEDMMPDADPAHWLDFGINAGNVAQALNGVPHDAFALLLAHSPDQIIEAQQAGADLMLAGHTHGGQVRLPWIGPLYINTELGRAYNQGLFQFGDTTLYVNRGVGTRGLPIRFLCPPEITVFTLRSTLHHAPTQ